MVQTIDMEAIRKLTRAQRMALIAKIWDTLAEEDDADLPISKAVLDEMERRAAEFDADPSIGIPHEEMMKRLRSGTSTARDVRESSNAILDEMERRSAELDVDPTKAVPHEEMMKRLRRI